MGQQLSSCLRALGVSRDRNRQASNAIFISCVRMIMTHLPAPYDLPLQERKVIAAFITYVPKGKNERESAYTLICLIRWKWWLYTRALMVLPKPAYKRLMAKANAKRWGVVAFVIGEEGGIRPRKRVVVLCRCVCLSDFCLSGSCWCVSSHQGVGQDLP